MSISVTLGDCVAVLGEREGPLFDACVTDPPYHLTSVIKRFSKCGGATRKLPAKHHQYQRLSRGFMGKSWDGGDVAFRLETWAAIFDQLKPGAHLVAFSGTRTYHRMVCAIEDAGFEIRDTISWHYGSGFPKSHDVSKGIDKSLGAKRGTVQVSSNAPSYQRGIGNTRPWMGDPKHRRDGPIPATAAAAAWEGWGTALKPSTELICLARKPLSEKSVAANVLKWGTGALNIDACRIDSEKPTGWAGAGAGGNTWNAENMGLGKDGDPRPVEGRWPANLVHDGSEEVIAAFPDAPGQQFAVKGTEPSSPFANVYGDMPNRAGGAARFFYSAKAGPLDRLGSAHATVKPVDLMRWLCRLVTPPKGLILDPFAGSGTTGIAAMADGFDCEMVELEAEHVADIERKLALLRGEGRSLIVEHNERKSERVKDALPLFGGAAA